MRLSPAGLTPPLLYRIKRPMPPIPRRTALVSDPLTPRPPPGTFPVTAARHPDDQQRRQKPLASPPLPASPITAHCMRSTTHHCLLCQDTHTSPSSRPRPFIPQALASIRNLCHRSSVADMTSVHACAYYLTTSAYLGGSLESSLRIG